MIKLGKAVERKLQKAHDELTSTLKSKEPNPTKHEDGYGGQKEKSLHLRVPVIRKTAKEFVKEKQDLTIDDWINLLHLLSKGGFSEEREIIGKILESHRELRRSIPTQEIEKLLSQMRGWSLVDSLCQSVFSAEEMSNRWSSWKKTIINLSESENLNKKRGSLVLLTAPIRQSSDERFSELALSIIGKLKVEDHKLVAKAISWLLREMIKNHRERVEDYLNRNEESLPSIAVRETKNKLATGKKT